MPADLSTYQWHDGTTIIQASSYNGGVNYLGTLVNNHFAGTADRHDTTHFGNATALTGTTARSLAAPGGYNAYQQLDMLVKTFLDIINNGADFSTVVIPTTLKTINDTLAGASSTQSVGKLVKWDATTGGITPPPATLPRSSILEFGGYASQPNSLVAHWRGGNYIDDSVIPKVDRFLADFTSTHTVPSAGNERWDCVSFNPTTLAVSTTTGTVAAIGAALLPSPPNADIVLGFVYNRAGMTVIKDASDGTNGFILTGYAMHNFGASSSGGGGGGALTSAVVGIGSGTPTSIESIFSGVQTGIINGINFDAVDASGMFSNKGWGALRTGVATDGSLADALRDYPGDAASRVYLQSNAAHYSAASWFPGNITINGRSRTVTAEPTAATASGSAGQRFLIADLSGAGAGFSLVSPMPNVDISSETGYKKALAIFFWDGTNLHLMADSVYDTSPLATIGSHQVTPTLFSLPAATTTSDTLTAADAVLNGMSGTLVLTKPSHVRFTVVAGYAGTGSPGTYNAVFTVYITGGSSPPGALTSYSTLAQQTGSVTGTAQIVTNRVPLQAGVYTVSLQGRVSNAAAAFTVFGDTKFLEAEVGN